MTPHPIPSRFTRKYHQHSIGSFKRNPLGMLGSRWNENLLSSDSMVFGLIMARPPEAFSDSKLDRDLKSCEYLLFRYPFRLC